MNLFNNYLQQLKQLVSSMSTAARVTSVLLLVAIVVSLFFLVRYQVTGGEAYLYGGRDFSQSELGAMEEALGKAGLNEYEIVGNKIKVPRSNRDSYLRAIAENGATPRMAHEYDELESSFNPFMSKEEQRNLEKSRTQHKIHKMICSMDGIQECAVQFSETETPGFPRTTVRTAAITVKPTGTRPLTEREANAIRNIAAGAVAGLKHQEIKIVDQNTLETFISSEDDQKLLPQNNALTQAKRYWESVYRKQIVERLHSYDPNVQVSVELDPTLTHIESSKTLDATPTVVGQSEETMTSRSTSGAPGGTPGVVTNNPPGGANGSASISSSQNRESVEDTSSTESKSVVGGTVSEIQKAGLAVESVKVSIGIPRSFYENKWAKENPPADGEVQEPMPDQYLQDNEEATRKKIQDIVHVLLPQPTQGDDLFRYIVVETDPVRTIETLPEPGMTDHAFSWLASNWQTLGLMLMGIVGLVMLRGMVKANTPDPSNDEHDEAAKAEGSDGVAGGAAEGEDPLDPDNPENQLMKRFGTSDRSLKEELTELVEKDIDAAANVLKTWIGDVGS